MLREQAPEFADLPIRRSPTSGSSNWVFRLGEDLAVRVPRTEGYVRDLLNEIRWLPHLAPKLMLLLAVKAVGDSALQDQLPGESHTVERLAVAEPQLERQEVFEEGRVVLGGVVDE